MSHILLTLRGFSGRPEDGPGWRVVTRRRDFSGAERILRVFEREAARLKPGLCLVLVDLQRRLVLRWAGTTDPLDALRNEPGLPELSLTEAEPPGPSVMVAEETAVPPPTASARGRVANGAVQYVAKNMRLDLRLIAGMIPPNVRVLDIGCGDGALMAELATKGVDARGIEIDMQAATEAVAQGLAVIHGDADNDLAFYPDGAFDYVVLSRTLQAVEKPREVLRQMLRIGRHAIVSFPNFGHWEMRLKLLFGGRMPDTETWSKPWYETPNIHPCTILDFFELAAMEGYVIEEWLAVDEKGLKAPWRRSARLANIFGEQALFQLRRG